ncbi:MAG TPA: YCF48-related protein [Ignavibacteria bacterium]
MRKLFSILLATSLILALSNNLLISQSIWQIVGSGTYENLNGISFPGVNTGYIAGNNGKLLKTTNLGYNWFSMTFPSNGDNYCVYFTNTITGFVGNQGGLYKTVNGGNNWNLLVLPSAYTITSIHFSSANTGWLGNYYGDILKSTDAGNTWATKINMPGYNSKIFFVNDFTGWGVDSYGYVYKTSNAGSSFTSKRISYGALYEVNFITSTIGMIAGDSGRIFKTVNGGVTWNLLNTGVYNNFKSIYLVNPNIAFVSGDAGIILETYNGGDLWQEQNINSNNLNKITFPSSTSQGWVVGDVGTLAKKVDQSNVCIGTGNIVMGYPFYTYYDDSKTDMLYLSSEIIAGGVSSTGAITKIGFQVDSISSQVMHGFTIKMQNTALPSLTGFVSTNWITVWTGDYTVPGTGWQYLTLQNPFVYTPGSNLLIEVCYNNSSWTANSFVFSSYHPGMTYHGHQDLPTGDGCIDITTGNLNDARPNICMAVNVVTNVHNNNNVVKDFKLFQNFPNPFNPSTNIKYDLPKSGFVKLVIYDVLGKEIAILVNEKQSPGTYEATFNASQFSSGVYFYKLTTDGFNDTKRMILLK